MKTNRELYEKLKEKENDFFISGASKNRGIFKLLSVTLTHCYIRNTRMIEESLNIPLKDFETKFMPAKKN